MCGQASAGLRVARRLAGALIKLAPHQLEFHEVSFAQLPLYSYDYDADFPAEAKAFKAELATARTNFPAQRLYETMGWRRDEVFHHYALPLR